MMPDPASALRELESFLQVPCTEWAGDLASRGVELDCEGVAAGQAALRQALEHGGTHHDVLGRVRGLIDAARLSARRRLAALAVAEVAGAASRRRLWAAFAQFGGPGPAAASP